MIALFQERVAFRCSVSAIIDLPWQSLDANVPGMAFVNRLGLKLPSLARAFTLSAIRKDDRNRRDANATNILRANENNQNPSHQLNSLDLATLPRSHASLERTTICSRGSLVTFG